MKYQPYHEKIVATRHDDEIRIISLLKTNLNTGNNSMMPLTNVFKGIPISNRSELIDVNEKFGRFKTNPLQLAAINAASETVIRFSFNNNETVIGKLDHLDIDRNIVTLKEFSFADLHIDKRAAVRVQLLPPLNVILHVDDKKISVCAHDMSIDGINISIMSSLGSILEHASSIKLQLKFWHNDVIKQTEITARLLHILKRSPFICILLFEHTYETENVLSIFLNQRQIDIIRELKEIVNTTFDRVPPISR